MTRPVRSDAGMTLVEVLVASSLLVVVIGSALAILTNVQRGFERQVDRAASLDQARAAMEQIQHEVASARAVTVPSGVSMDVYTRTNENTRGGSKCVQWRVEDGELQSRTWDPLGPAGQSVTWRIIATNLTNADTAAAKLFELDSNAAYADRLVNMTVRVNVNPAKERDTVIAGSAFGRNIQYGVADPCATNQPT